MAGIDLEDLNRQVRHNHFNAWLDLQVTGGGEGEIEMRVPWRQEIESNRDGAFVHGGILGTLVDVAAAFAIRTIVGNAVRTVDMRVDYHAPGGGELIVRGKTVRVGKTIATADAWVFKADGKLVASGRATFIVLDPARGQRR